MAAALENAELGTACPPTTGNQGDVPVVKGIPVRAGPGIVGARVNNLQPPPVSVPATLLDIDEQAVLNYQMAVFCFAFLDTFSSILNIVAVYSMGLKWNCWQLFFILLFVGPICGLLGASRLKRSLVAVFVAFCALKAVVQVMYALYSFYFWTILFAFLQCWITKIAATFWWVLGNLTKERRRKVLEVKTYEVQRVYW
eukprot:Skav205802  [mRNA]  locus=scaffold307:194392:195373:- [translate_table: standard]